MLNEIKNKVDELAKSVVPEQFLESFLQLDLKAKLAGIGTFAHMSNDQAMVEFSLKATKYIEEGTI